MADGGKINKTLLKNLPKNGGCSFGPKYEILAEIGQGSYGVVYKARHRRSQEIVAVKKIIMGNTENEAPVTAIRERDILNMLRHENVVNLIEVCKSEVTPYTRLRPDMFLVMEFCAYNLADLIEDKCITFCLGEIKIFMKQLLNGLRFTHGLGVLHRDLKPDNILITKNGVVKLADFSLSRTHISEKNGQPNCYTNRVVSLWYRPPELLLGEQNYGPSVDMWSVGCIMAEMWTRSPIMPGKVESHQLTLISELCGSIDTNSFPGVDRLELYNHIELLKGQERLLMEWLELFLVDSRSLDLIDKLLVIDPAQRIDAHMALSHDFFLNSTFPNDLSWILWQHSSFKNNEIA